ncbi:hypothetical protein BS50DRAFT_596807 [Corynespora cassiicola Philippines]|uniref:Uncharacterized protein n=1 Tax=Corynespora cassiicola Philippines TaxID=1448308 RepID=A0A2T2P640_CORCC|nr:hypothetical protein BS50DRAFT_596807 [Corynespora cassiicola Philippines]
MVLQDLSDASSDSFTDNPYPSENDPYASSSSGSNYDATDLPQPIPVVGPFLGFSQAAIRFKTESTIKFAERRIGRNLTGEEAHTLAGYLYKLEQTKSYFTAGGAAIGTWRWYNTMAVNRYPLYLPKPGDIDPNKFMFVKGPMAQYARHSWRLFLYVFCVGELGKLMGQIVAQPLVARDTANDTRLGQFSNDLRNALSNNQQNRREVHKETPQRRVQGDSQPFPPARRPQSPAARTTDDDDMSPTAGNEPWPSSSSGDWGSTSAAPSQQQPSEKKQPSPPWVSARSTRSDDDDDASPTGGLFQEEVQNQSKPGESAWERLRRGGAPPPAQRPPRNSAPPRKEHAEGSTLGDSWTFAESEEDRKRARETAQQEFDARIERERQGKDFNDERKW